MNYGRLMRFVPFIIGVCALAFALDANAFQLPPMNMPYGATPISHQIYHLHMAAFYVCCGIGVVVFGTLFYCLLKFRKSQGAKAANFHEHLGVEILWTLIPFLILIALAIPATLVLKNIHNTEKPKIDIKVTGQQWKWEYSYLDDGLDFISNLSTTQAQIQGQAPKDKWFLLEVDKPLVLPINEKVRLLVTSDDVVHSWWVPDLGIKQDAVPGYVNENWLYITKPGTYRGQCGELCGALHGFMPIVVKALPQMQYQEWLHKEKIREGLIKADNKPSKQARKSTKITDDDLFAQGKQVYKTRCALCHQASGQGLPPTFPALKGSKLVVGDMNQAIKQVLNGKPGTAMVAFRNELNDTEIAAVVTYIRQAFGNDALIKKAKLPLVAEPSEVNKLRSEK